MLLNGAPGSLALGQLGSLYVKDTAAHAGSWGIIQAHEATVIASATSANHVDGKPVVEGTLVNVALPAGMAWYGMWTTFTLSSGSVTAYKYTR